MLKVERVVSGYGKAIICQGISIHVDDDELVTIIGPNGSGKTTLLKTICGLVPAYSGSVIFDNNEITKIDPSELPHIGLGYVPQLENVFPNLTIWENLEIGALWNLEQFDDNLKRVFRIFPILKDRQNLKAKTLSGGERQMLALARALMGNPKMLLLDEPTAALSPVLAMEILEIVERLAKEEHIPILLVEQNAKKSLKISDRAYIFTNGKVFREGVAKEILADEKIGEAFLGA